MTKISRRRLAETTVRLLREQPTKRAHIARAVAAYLLEHGQAKQLDLLLKDIARELQQADGVLLAEVYSAFGLQTDAQAALKNYLQRATGAKRVELEAFINPELISGVVVRTADQELDTTARRALTQLASLNSGGNQ